MRDILHGKLLKHSFRQVAQEGFEHLIFICCSISDFEIRTSNSLIDGPF